MGPNDGILIVHIDTNVKVESIETSAGTIAKDLAPGEHFSLYVVGEGTYRWNRINRKVQGFDVHWQLWPWRLKRSDKFTVKRGHLNYLGLLKLRRGEHDFHMYVRPYNQSAVMYRKIEQLHPDLLAKMPIRYAGPERDEFLERYQQAKKAQSEMTTAPERP
ncbi:MAG: hypothetical protein ABGX04_04165 [Myxococcales bacterium]